MTNSDQPSEVSEQLARLVKKAKPHAERLVATAKPRVEKASQDALRLAQDHEGELKQVAQRIIRSRVTGPLGLLVDALAPATPNHPPHSLHCKACQTANPINAKFCNQCGIRLEEPG